MNKHKKSASLSYYVGQLKKQKNMDEIPMIQQRSKSNKGFLSSYEPNTTSNIYNSKFDASMYSTFYPPSNKNIPMVDGKINYPHLIISRNISPKRQYQKSIKLAQVVENSYLKLNDEKSNSPMKKSTYNMPRKKSILNQTLNNNVNQNRTQSDFNSTSGLNSNNYFYKLNSSTSSNFMQTVNNSMQHYLDNPNYFLKELDLDQKWKAFRDKKIVNKKNKKQKLHVDVEKLHNNQFIDPFDQIDEKYQAFKNVSTDKLFKKSAAEQLIGREILNPFHRSDTNKLQNSLTHLLGHDSTSLQPIVELKEAIPKYTDFKNTNNFQFYIDCKNKLFPAYICPNKTDINCTYYINLDNIEEKMNTNTGSLSSKINGMNKSPKKNCTKKLFNPKKINAKLIRRPDDVFHDAILHGGYVQFDLNNHYKCDKSFDTMCVLVICKSKVGATFSVSFTSEKYLKMNDKTKFEAFSNKHKNQLFEDVENMYKEIDIIKEKRKDIQEKNDKIENNKASSKFAGIFRMENINKNNEKLNERTVDVQKNSRLNLEKRLTFRIKFQQRNTELKREKQEEILNRTTTLKKFLTGYFWIFLIKYYDIFEEIQTKFRMMKLIKQQWSYKMKALISIQELGKRFVERHKGHDCIRRTQKYVVKALYLTISMFKGIAYENAKETLGKFFSYNLISLKSKTLKWKFSNSITNIQRKWKKHLKVKQQCIYYLESLWDTAQKELITNEQSLLDSDIHFDIHALLNIPESFKQDILKHLVDRQILRYTDVRYQFLTKVNDKISMNKMDKAVMFEHMIVEYEKTQNKRPNREKISIFDIGKSDNKVQINPVETTTYTKTDTNLEKIYEVEEEILQEKKQIIEADNINTEMDLINTLNPQSKSQSKKSILIDRSRRNISTDYDSNPGEPKKGNLLIPKPVPNLLMDTQSEIEELQERKESQKFLQKKSILNKFASKTESLRVFLNNCIHDNYQFDSTKLWQNLEDSKSAELFREILKFAPDFLRKKKQFEEEKVKQQSNENSPETSIISQKTLHRSKNRQLRSQASKFVKCMSSSSEFLHKSLQIEINEKEEQRYTISAGVVLPNVSSKGFSLTLSMDIMQAIVQTTAEYTKDLDLFKKETIEAEIQ